MLKPGIWRSDGLTAARLRGPWGSRRHLSIALYEEIGQSAREDRDEIQERILFHFPTRTGTYKRTYRNRFPEFDEQVVRAIREHAPITPLCRVHDVGVSDGRTSLDFYRRLRGIPDRCFSFLASDLAPFVTLVRSGKSRLSIALDDTDALLQVTWPPFVFSLLRPETPWIYPINALVRRRLLSGPVPRLLARYRERPEELEVRRIALVHPDLERLVREHEDVDLAQYDLMTKMTGSFHVIRVMNLLNPLYFSEEELARGVRHVHSGLEEGGLFIVGRNDDPNSPLQASIYLRAGARLEELNRYGDGAPIHELVVSRDWP
jgi:hypothetical protein